VRTVGAECSDQLVIISAFPQDDKVFLIEPQVCAPLPPLAAKDRPILLAAIRVGAKYLLTGDKTRFGPYFGQVLGGVTVLPPSEYFRLRAVGES